MSAELDINDLIRQNFNFLQEQMVYDACETKLRKEYGDNWPEEANRKTLQQMAKENAHFMLKLEKAISEIEGVPGWHFQNKDLEFPRPTAEWISKQTGLKKKTIENLNTSKRFLAEELVAIAAAMNTSIQALLTPSAEYLTVNTDIAIASQDGRRRIEASTGNWFLWLHNLKSLPSQQPYLYERNNSYVGHISAEKHKNAGIGLDDLDKKIKKSRFGDFSEFEAVENFKRISSSKSIQIFKPVEPEPIRIQQWTIRNALGLLVEERKLFREETVRAPETVLRPRLSNGQTKVRNHIVRIMRLLRNS